MTRSVLVDKVSEKVEGLTRKQTEIVMETVFDSIKEALQRGEKIEIRGFGNFRLKTRTRERQETPRQAKALTCLPRRCSTSRLGKNSGNS